MQGRRLLQRVLSILRRKRERITTWSFQVLVALACDLRLDTLSLYTPSDSTHKWAWFRRYCTAYRVSSALEKRQAFPHGFLNDVKRKIQEIQGACACAQKKNA